MRLRRRRRPAMVELLHPSAPALAALAHQAKVDAYQDGMAAGVEMVLDELDGRGHSSYTGAVPMELTEWIADVRRRVKEDQAERSAQRNGSAA